MLIDPDPTSTSQRSTKVGNLTRLRWLGVAGWEISFGSTTILFDPWLTRTVTGQLSGRPPDYSVSAAPNEQRIDEFISTASVILVSHSHYDHLADVPYIATRTGAQVLAAQTHLNLLRASDVPERQLCTVKGGEHLQFDGFSIEVFPSLHGLGATKQFILPFHLHSVPPRPTTVADFPEGDTLSYQVTTDDGLQLFLQGTANFIERAIAGIQPDVAVLAVGASQIHRYVPRLMHALAYPRIVLPNHWDNWERPFGNPPEDIGLAVGGNPILPGFISEVKQVSPDTEVVVPAMFEPFSA